MQIAEDKGHTAVVEALRSLVADQIHVPDEHSAASKLDEKQSADPAKESGDPKELCDAAEVGNCSHLRKLLEKPGTDVNAMAEVKGSNGQTVQEPALLTAVRANQEEAIELLLKHRADPSLAASNSITPLTAASCHGSLSITCMRKLIKHGTDMDAVYPGNGRTVFHVACVKGQADCAAELVKAGCSTSLQGDRGNTGWDLAEQQGHTLLISRCRLAKRQQSKAPPQHSGAYRCCSD